jgi:hypothetical protein
LHLHPAVALETVGPSQARLSRDGRTLALRAEGAELMIAPSSWHPRFNRSEPSRVVVAAFDGPRLSLRLEVV